MCHIAISMNFLILPNKEKGFTLIELLVVISIISLLSSVVLAALNSARQKAKVSQTASMLKQIVNALSLYHCDHNGNYPCFDHVWDDTWEKNQFLPYLKWPKDPLGTPPNDWVHWENNYGPFTYSISLSSPGGDNALALDKYMDDEISIQET